MTSKVINLCRKREMCCMCFLLKFRFEGYSKQSTIKNMFDLSVCTTYQRERDHYSTNLLILNISAYSD